MSEEELERDKYKRWVDERFHNPEVTAECLKQYDKGKDAQRRLMEYRQSFEAQETLYRQILADHRNAVKRVEEAERKAGSATFECEKATAALKEMRKGYESVMRKVNESQIRYDALTREKIDIEARYKELEARYVDAVKSGKEMQDKYDVAEAEIQSLDNRVRCLQEQISLGKKDKFGATTERTTKLFGDGFDEEDPLSEKMPDPYVRDEDGGAHTSDCAGGGRNEGNGYPEGEPEGARDDGNQSAQDDVTERDQVQDGGDNERDSETSGDYSSQRMIDKIWDLLTGSKGKKSRKDGHKDSKTKSRKRQWKRSGIYDSISDHVNIYNYDPDELDRIYAGKKWRIIGFDEKRTVGETRPHNYVKHEFTPVISVTDADGTERIVTGKAESDIYPHSYASDSIFCSVAIKRYGMSLPLYRIEKEYASRGIPLSRGTMCNWIMHFALGVFAPVYDGMWDWLKEHCSVQQCDETTWEVIIWPKEDEQDTQKANGSKGYVWVHTNSELADGHKIILYSFEKSRSAEHLREHISNLVLYLVSDAYPAYGTIEKEHRGILSVCNCWMHCRRAWARAVYVMEPGINDISIEELVKRPEVQGLLLANAVFEADTPLKTLSADERKHKRLETVAPRIDDFFEFIHSIDMDDPSVDGKLREAVIYSLNQEKRLRVFLEDGNIPIDNGYVERCIKPLALSRRNSLFSYTVFGAECSMIMYTLVETAKANGADPYIYIKYLVNELPKYLDGVDRTFIDDMMPWSEKYLTYEREQLRLHVDERVPESNAPPGRKKGKKAA